MLATKSTIQLLCGIILFLITSGLSIYILCHADQEAKRLLRARNWARPQENEDSAAFQKIRRRLIIGYWGFLVLSVWGLVQLGIELYKRL